MDLIDPHSFLPSFPTLLFRSTKSASIEWSSIAVALPAFLTIAVQPLTFSIANGIYFGVASALVLYITSGKVFGDLHRALRCGKGAKRGAMAGDDGGEEGRDWDAEAALERTLLPSGDGHRHHGEGEANASVGSADAASSLRSLIGEPEEALQPKCAERVDLQTGQRAPGHQ